MVPSRRPEADRPTIAATRRQVPTRGVLGSGESAQRARLRGAVTGRGDDVQRVTGVGNRRVELTGPAVKFGPSAQRQREPGLVAN